MLTDCYSVDFVAEKRAYKRRDPGAPLPQFALNIRRLRESAVSQRTGRTMTQEELAEESGLSTIVMIETGRRPYARDSTLGRIAKALSRTLGREVTIDELRSVPRGAGPEETRESFDAFLRSELSQGITDAERDQLRRAVWPWGVPSVKAWYFALEAMRASRREG
jgi:transcriptional regulator with XRE-family HTH domain